MRPRQPPEACIYCGVAPGTTKDDVPPKNLFLRPLPQNFVKVPACQPCNAGFSKDDEYLRLALYERSDVMAHPTARALQPDALRAFEKLQKQRFATAYKRRNERGFAELPSGLIVPVTAHDVDPRVVRSMVRITKALYYHHAGAVLPPGVGVEVGAEPQWHHLDEAPELIRKLDSQPLVDVGEGVFQYRYLINEEVVGVSIWFLLFYRAVPWITITSSMPARHALQVL